MTARFATRVASRDHAPRAHRRSADRQRFDAPPPHLAGLVVGYRAQHTLGRRLIEQRTRVRILGVERERRAEVVVLNGFSAHPDPLDLVDYAAATRERADLQGIVVVRGDPKPQKILAKRGMGGACIPAPGDKHELS